MSQQEGIIKPEARKKEGLTYNLGDKFKKFLVETTAVAKTEVETTHGSLVTDQNLSEMERNSLRDVAGMAEQQLNELLKEASVTDPLASEQEPVDVAVEATPPEPVKEPAAEATAEPKADEPPGLDLPPAQVPDEGKLKEVQGDLEQVDKEIKLLQEKLPNLKGNAYTQAIGRLEDLVRYEQELAAHEMDVKDPMIIEPVWPDDKTPDVPAGRKTPDSELEMSPDEATAAEQLKLNWEEPLKYEQGELEGVLQMMEAGQEYLERFKEQHADSPGLTPIEQQYVWTLETDLHFYKTKGEFIENSIAGITAQKTLQDLPPTPENAAALEQAKTALTEALGKKIALGAALVAANEAMQEARGSYSRLLAEAGVKVEADEQRDDAQAEIERAEEWSFGRGFDGDDRRGGSGFESSGPRSKEVVTLQGGYEEGQKEPGVLRTVWKGIAGWFKKIFG